jgi:hypothetical protein
MILQPAGDTFATSKLMNLTGSAALMPGLPARKIAATSRVILFRLFIALPPTVKLCLGNKSGIATERL